MHVCRDSLACLGPWAGGRLGPRSRRLVGCVPEARRSGCNHLRLPAGCTLRLHTCISARFWYPAVGVVVAAAPSRRE